MKVIIFSNSDVGLYKFRKEFIEQLTKNDEVFLYLPNGDYREDLENFGCKYMPLEFSRRGVNPFADLKQLLAYGRILKEKKPDVVFTYTVKPNVYGGLACRLAHIPYIATITGLGIAIENPGLLQKLVFFLYRIGLKKASAVMFQNKANKKLFEEKRIGQKYHLVPGSGVNLEEYCYEQYPAEDADIHLTFVGRIMKDKGINELLEAAKFIKQKYPAVQFDLIGGFDESYQNIVQVASDEQIVNYLGVQRELNSFYRDSWAVIMPSYHEGISNVCLEAASTGRPILASNVSGCKETFDDGVSGIGFEAKSSIALTEAIEKFLALSYEEKVAMGVAGREKMEREFDRNFVVQAYISEIEAIKEVKQQ